MTRALLLWWARLRLDFLADQMRICVEKRDLAMARGDGIAFVYLSEIFDRQCERRDRLEVRIASLSTTTERQFS